MMRKTIPNKPQFPLFGILSNRIIRIRLGNLHLGIRPPRNLNNHIENLRARSTIRGQQRNIMPGRNYHPFPFKVDAMFMWVCRTYLLTPTKTQQHNRNRMRGGGSWEDGDGGDTNEARSDDACHCVQMSVKLGSPLTSYSCQTNVSDENFDEKAMRLMELKKFSRDAKRAVILVTRETETRDARE
jgi:hypothetical protein